MIWWSRNKHLLKTHNPNPSIGTLLATRVVNPMNESITCHHSLMEEKTAGYYFYLVIILQIFHISSFEALLCPFSSLIDCIGAWKTLAAGRLTSAGNSRQGSS